MPKPLTVWITINCGKFCKKEMGIPDHLTCLLRNLYQCVKVKSESEVAQSCPTLSDAMDCSLPGSSIHGIFQARVLEWDAIAFSTCIGRCVLYL